jgi:ParB-like chromosome segregation protein Spo0J
MQPERLIVDVDKIKFDPDNPNIMTKDQMNGLRESFKEFGYLQPIIIDQKYRIIDGEHRFQVWKELNPKEQKISVIGVEANSESERRLVRQAMNKVKGQHDLNKDIKEIQIIMSKDKHRESIKKILQVDRESVNKMKAVLEKQKTIERNARILSQDWRLSFFLDENDYKLVTETLDTLSQDKNDALVGLCKDWRIFVGTQGKDKKIERIKLRQKQLATMNT